MISRVDDYQNLALGAQYGIDLRLVTRGPFGLAARLCISLNDAGDRQFLQDWRLQVRDVLRGLHRWPAETRQELRAAWHETDTDERERNQRKIALRPHALPPTHVGLINRHERGSG
jgi:hypothetical protein